MFNTRKSVVCLIIFTFVLGISSCKPKTQDKTQTDIASKTKPPTEATVVKSSTDEKEKKSPQIIFVQSAKAAILKKLGERGYYTLTLYDVNPYVTYYKERPSRDNGIFASQELIKIWDQGENSFYTNNPNGLLMATQIDGLANKNGKFYLLTCSTPKYELEKGQFSYVVKPLPNQQFIFDHIQLTGVTLVLD
jgi:hypothetical protein